MSDYRSISGEGAGVRTFRDVQVSQGYRDDNGFMVYVLTPGGGALNVRDVEGVEHDFTGITEAQRLTVDGTFPLICSQILAAGSTVTTVRVYRTWQ